MNHESEKNYVPTYVTFNFNQTYNYLLDKFYFDVKLEICILNKAVTFIRSGHMNHLSDGPSKILKYIKIIII